MAGFQRGKSQKGKLHEREAGGIEVTATGVIDGNVEEKVAVNCEILVDQALDQSKESGRNRVTRWDEL